MFLKNGFKIFLLTSVFLFIGVSVCSAGTFGWQGGAFVNPTFHIGEQITGSLFYLSEKGEVSKITAYIDFSANASTTAGIYDSDKNLVATTTIVENTTGGSIPVAWFDFTFPDENPILEIGNYWLVAWSSNQYAKLYLEDSTTLETHQTSVLTGQFPVFPASVSLSFENTKNSAIYGTYDKLSTYITISSELPTSTLAYAGQLFTDLSIPIILTIGLPMAFWVIKKIIALV